MAYELLLAAEDEIEEGSLQRITANDIDFCVARINGAVSIVEDRCPHMNVPLSFGTLEGCVVTCPQHRAAFDLSNFTKVADAVMGGGGGGREAPSSPPDPEMQARLERRAKMMAAVRTKPLVVFTPVQRDGSIYVLLPDED